MRQKFEKVLANISRRILRRYKPKIVGITGSIGKTSAKEAIFSVLSSKFSTRKSIKNFNNEFGLPLTIIGLDSPRKNVFKWLWLFIKSFWMIYVYSVYPEYLVLEMGIDRPGDMEKLLAIVKPDFGVFTSAGISHLQNFKSPEQILSEKAKIFKFMGRHEHAILNIDDLKIRTVIPGLHANIITYGFGTDADVRILDYKITYGSRQHSIGTLFRLQYKEAIAPVFLNGIVGVPHIVACAAGAAVGLRAGMKLDEIAKALGQYQAEPGRLGIIAGINKSILIDDSYNAAPDSMHAAIKEFAEFPAKTHIAVLGDMLELGTLSDRSHAELGKSLADSKPDFVVLVGPQMRLAVDSLKKSGYNNERLFHFEKSADAGQKVYELVAANAGSVVLIKGSRGMHMENVIKNLIEN